MAKLQGWKDIAGHLGKSVRTVQRWERDYGLPVRRLGREGGEIVWAESDDLDEWLRRASPAGAAAPEDHRPPPTEHSPAPIPPDPQQAANADGPGERAGGWRPRRWPLALAAAAAMLALLALALNRRESPALASAKVAGGNVIGLSSDGTTLWIRSLSVPLDDGQYALGGRQGSSLLVADLDGDGTREVVLSVRDDQHPTINGLYIFDADGRPRLERFAPQASATFGAKTYVGPWWPFRIWTLEDSGRTLLYAAFIDLTDYPTMVLQLDGRGRELGRYWSNGYVRDIRGGTFMGQPAVLVGGVNNDTNGASLAVLPRDQFRATAPARRPDYACASCGPGTPLAFLVFPQRCIGKALAGQPHVEEVRVDADGGFRVYVGEGPTPNDQSEAGAWYMLDANLRPREVLMASGLIIHHRRMHAAGDLDHELGPQDEDALFPVLRWSGSAFEPLPRAPVKRQGS